LKLHELFDDRVESGPISNEKFRAILAAAVAEFEAQPAKRRRRGGRRGRPQAAPFDPFNDAEQVSADELRRSLH
jgi:hypothetical protein